jgi:hypothetical protein
MRVASGGRYHIADEPRPSALSNFATDPMWPFLALMLAGPWLGFPWFVFNGIAIGSARLKREVAIAIIAWLGLAVVVVAVLWVHGALGLPDGSLRYLKFIFIVWRMTAGYMLHLSQLRSFQLYRYLGGPARGGWLVILGGFFAGNWIQDQLFHLPGVLWILGLVFT